MTDEKLDRTQLVNGKIKEHSIAVAISTIGSLIPVLLAVWFLIKPTVIDAVASSLEGEMQQKVTRQLRPISNAFKILLRNNINGVRLRIAQLEHKRSTMGDAFTSVDAQELETLRIELEALTEAYGEL